MSFNPTQPYSFNYLQTQPVPEIQVTFDLSGFAFVSPTNIQFLNKPPWLQIINVSYNDGQELIFFTLKINEAYAYTMAEGDYSQNIRLRFNTGVFDNTYTSSAQQVTLNVQHLTVLSATPSIMSFSYIIGGSNPQNQTLQIQSSTNWSITPFQSWVTLSSTNGFGNGQVAVGVDPSGLSAGNYSAILDISDSNGFLRQVNISLTVTTQDSESTYLYVTPTSFQFVSQLGEENTSQQNITLDASHSWSGTIQGSWLVLSATSGSSGNQILNVSVDSEALEDTSVSYLGIITFTSQNIIKTVYVELILVEFLTQGMASETLYYADDRNKLQTTNVFNTDFLLLEGVASNGVSNTPFKFSAPYQNGVAKALFGLEANQLLKSVSPTSNFTTRIQNNISPLLVNYLAYNKNKSTGVTTLIEQYSNIRVLRGKTPTTAKKLTYIPNEVTVVKNAVLSLSTQETTAPTQIVITGDHEATITTSIADSLYVYNAIINLEAFDLSPGDAINIAFGTLSLDVYIDDASPFYQLIAFENEWQEYELFNCKGKLSIEANASKTVSETQIEDTVYTKITSIDFGKTYEINTGFIHSQEEIEWLSKILDSKRVFIYIDNTPIEVILETNKLETFKTREYLKSFKLKFKKAIV